MLVSSDLGSPTVTGFHLMHASDAREQIPMSDFYQGDQDHMTRSIEAGP